MSTTTITQRPQPEPTPPVKLARRARHRKPNRRRGVIAKLAGASLLVAAITGSTAAAGHGTHGPAFGGIAPQTVTAAYTSPNWTAKTCSAFATWQRHKTTGNLDAMMTDSEHVAWKYIGEDVTGVYRDIRSGKTKYLVDDVHYLVTDCHPGSGL